MLICYEEKDLYNPANKCLVCGSNEVIGDLFTFDNKIPTPSKHVGYLCDKHLEDFERVRIRESWEDEDDFCRAESFLYNIPDYIPEEQYTRYIKKIILKEICCGVDI